jgi:hypothetical protein
LWSGSAGACGASCRRMIIIMSVTKSSGKCCPTQLHKIGVCSARPRTLTQYKLFPTIVYRCAMLKYFDGFCKSDCVATVDGSNSGCPSTIAALAKKECKQHSHVHIFLFLRPSEPFRRPPLPTFQLLPILTHLPDERRLLANFMAIPIKHNRDGDHREFDQCKHRGRPMRA